MSKRIDKKKLKKQTETAACTVAAAPCAQEDAGRINLYIQYQDQEYRADKIIEKVKENCRMKGILEAEEISIYLKPEERKAYYTCSGKSGGIEV